MVCSLSLMPLRYSPSASADSAASLRSAFCLAGCDAINTTVRLSPPSALLAVSNDMLTLLPTRARSSRSYSRPQPSTSAWAGGPVSALPHVSTSTASSQISDVPLAPTVASQVFTLANFYLTTWEEYHTGVLFLSSFSGPVEGIIIIVVIFFITGLYGGLHCMSLGTRSSYTPAETEIVSPLHMSTARARPDLLGPRGPDRAIAGPPPSGQPAAHQEPASE